MKTVVAQSAMFSRPSFVLFLCLVCFVVLPHFSGGKPQSSSIKPSAEADKPKAAQSIVVNNNCGLPNGEIEMLAYIKAKVDYIASKSKGPVCSDGWVAHGNSCFLVIDIPTLSWNDARRNCQRLGGDLAKITSAIENQFIFGLLLKQNNVIEMGAWLGLHRKADKKFYWADGSPLSGYTAWDSGEPGSTEECGHIMALGSGKGRWNDWHCTLDKTAISRAPVVLCQKSLK